MKCTTIVLLLLMAGIANAQPQHGDLVFSVADSNLTGGFVGVVDPMKPGTLNTLFSAPSRYMQTWVRMSPNNLDVVTAHTSFTYGQSFLVNVDMSGAVTATLATLPNMDIDGFELDHDNTWIMCGNDMSGRSFLHGVHHSTRTSRPIITTLLSSGWFNEMAIDRDPGPYPGSNLPYTLVTCCHNAPTGPLVMKADRQGTITSILSGGGNPPFVSLELHPRSGDFIVGLGGTGPSNPGATLRMTKAGTWTTLTTWSANGIKITQDDVAWLAHGGSCQTPSPPCRTVLRYDLTNNAVLGTVATGIPVGHGMTGIDVYGSRPLACNQKSAAKVAVNVQSRHPFVVPARTQYALAASFARRPGLKFPNGEWLDLDTLSPLFLVTAQNLLPTVFQGFRGVVGQGGNASAGVNIPKALQGSGITVFVAGVLFDTTQGVIQVTNTHWFVL